HVLDQIDPAARAVEFIAQQHVGRTGRGAKAAVHALAQYLLGLGGVRIGQLRGVESRLHQLMRPGFRRLCGSNAALKRAAIAAMAGACGSNTTLLRRSASSARTKVACPPCSAPRMRAASTRSAPTQISPPP